MVATYLNNLRDALRLEVEQSVAVSIRMFGSKAEKTQICDVVKLGLKARTGVDLELSLYVMPLICEPLSGQPLDLIVQRTAISIPLWFGP